MTPRTVRPSPTFLRSFTVRGRPKSPAPDPVRILVPFKVKAITREGDEDDGPITELEGVGSVFDVLDHHTDVVHAGAFTKTVGERVPAGLVKLLDSHGSGMWGPTMDDTLGTIVKAWEVTDSSDPEENGLHFKATVSQEPTVQRRMVKVKEGHIDRLSIGYDTTQQTWEERKTEDGGTAFVRHIHEVVLFEISLVPLAANESARVTAVKGVLACRNLETAPDGHEWDADAAFGRLTDYVERKDARAQWPHMQRAFLYQDATTSQPLARKSYRFQVADVVDGRLVFVPAAVKAAARALHGDEHGIPEAALPPVRAHVARYLAAMGDAAPWEAKGVVEISSAAAAIGCDSSTYREDVVAAVGRLDTDTKAAIMKALTAGETATEEPDAGGGDSDEAGQKRARVVQAMELDLARSAAR